MKKKERRTKHEHHIIYGDTRTPGIRETFGECPCHPPLSENAHAIPLRGDMVRIEAEELPCPYSRKMLETIPASRCFVRNEETEKTSMAEFLKKCELTVYQREWHFENGRPACTLSVEVEW